MAEHIQIPQGTKEEIYRTLVPQIAALISSERDTIANLANVSAVLKQVFEFFWVGFYIVRTECDTPNTCHKESLVLGPFQGPLACTRIQYGRGVCGASWQRSQAILVHNVDEFPGHIACSSDSKSEVVVPVVKDGRVVAILDVDSDTLDNFDATDLLYLTEICCLIAPIFNL